MKMPRQIVENQSSGLLSTEENLQVFKLLGNRCQSIATTVVQLLTTTPPNHLQWIKKATGVLCFVKDNSKKNYFFRLFSLKRNQIVWEHEMYNNMEYAEYTPFFHTFEGKEYIVAFNFRSPPEAKAFKTVVDQKILLRRRKEKKKRQFAQTESLKWPQKNLDFGTNQKSEKDKRKIDITKDDISKPMDFVHISHVGWNSDTGFDVLSEETGLQSVFQKAGVSEKQLQDKNTREFIYEFISKHRDAPFSNDPNPPAVPSRAPPRPSSGNPRPAPPPPSVHRASSLENYVPRKSRPPSPPKQTMGDGPVPPPPPPPPVMMENVPPPPPMMMGNGGPTVPSKAYRNSAFLQSIKDGTTLKPVEERKTSPVDNARGDLLSEIRKGIPLRRAGQREIIKPTENDLASALKKALDQRSSFIRSDDSDDDDDTSSNWNDDEWDD